MTEHFNGLTPSEAERIAILMEECAEVIHICAKTLRHGYESYDPTGNPENTNRHMLEIELGDVEHAMALMWLNDDIDNAMVAEACALKSVKIRKYLHHQSE